jgi:putative iron-regulated protein
MSIFKKLLTASAAASLLAGCNLIQTEQASEISSGDVIDTYVSIAQAGYGDSLSSAKNLETSIDSLLATPSEQTLSDAKKSWIAARVPYQQTEVYRFGNASVDNWEGKVNAWPLDEGLIDYVDAGYGSDSDENPFYTANIIANPNPTIGGKLVDASQISVAFLSEVLHEIDEVESNVATGYHVIEFLLWGQDLNGTNPGSGARPASDFSLTSCTGGNCERRRAYLKSATQLLISDLNDMVASWQVNGTADKELTTKGDRGGLATMLTGMGSLAYGELAGERIKLGLMLHDPEEEHDCFSDNTHWSHYYDAKGINNIYLGEYQRIDGSLTKGASLSDLVRKVSPDLDNEMKAKLSATEAAMQAMVDEAAKGNTFDVLIGESNESGNQVVQNIVNSLVAQTKITEKIVVALGLDTVEVGGSDSLDNPSAITD